MKSQLCIMIECENNRNIFTNKKNLNLLVEFAKHFDLKLHYAKTDASNIVGLEKVAKLYCDQTYQSTQDFKIIKENIIGTKNNRFTITNKAKKIREKISKIILKHKKITFKQIQDKFESEDISTSALCNHFTHVRHELATQGIVVKKIKNGVYEVLLPSRKPAI